MPKSGRLAYQLLPVETKAELDTFVTELLNQEKKFQKEAEKLIANRILGAIKVLLKKERDIENIEFTGERKRYYTEQLLMGLIDLFGRQLKLTIPKGRWFLRTD